MSKVQLGPRRLLELIRHGIRAGNYQAAIDIIDDCIEQLPPDALFSVEAGEALSQDACKAVSEREPKDASDTLQAQLGTLREALKEMVSRWDGLSIIARHRGNRVEAVRLEWCAEELSALLRDET